MNRTHLRLFVSAICVGIFLSTSTPTARADALDNWTTNQVSTNWFGLGHVVYGNGRYVAAGSWSSYGAYLSSEDGLNWMLRVQGDTNGAGNVYSLVFSEGRFMTTGGPLGARTGISTNGIDWLFGWVDVAAHLRGMAYGAGKYVVVADALDGNRKNFFTSTNGTDWAGPLLATARDYKDIAYGAGVFVAVTGDGYVHVSSGGTAFSRFPEFAGTGSSISYCKNLFISPSSSGTNALSSDGYFWTTAYTGIAEEMWRVKYENGIFIARTTNHLVTSTDGTNWVQQTASALPGTGEIAFDGTRFVNVGSRWVSSPLPMAFDSFVYASAPLVALELAWEASAQLRLSGLVGHPHRIEYLPSLPASATNPWQTLTNLILPSSPYFIADPESPSAAQRYYRGVLLP